MNTNYEFEARDAYGRTRSYAHSFLGILEGAVHMIVVMGAEVIEIWEREPNGLGSDPAHTCTLRLEPHDF